MHLRCPAQDERIQSTGRLDEACASRRMERWKRMPRSVGSDDAALLHESFAREQAALTVFIIDQRQPSLVRIVCVFAASGRIRVDNLANAIRITPASHGSSSA